MMGMWSGMIWMMLSSGLFLAVVLGIVVWLGLRTTDSSRSPARSERRESDDGPYALLRHRYAAGEIDEDEYLQRLSGLSQR